MATREQALVVREGMSLYKVNSWANEFLAQAASAAATAATASATAAASATATVNAARAAAASTTTSTTSFRLAAAFEEMGKDRLSKLWVRLFKGTCKRYGRENRELSGYTFVPVDCDDPLVPLRV